jgi:hypothetical protein
MAIYLRNFNLIINKKAVIEKYAGGIEQFRKDYNIPASEINEEDDELFSLGQMNVDPFESHIDDLISKGLDFDLVQNRSDDFTIASRFSDLFWKVDWLKQNYVFAWHIDTSNEIKLKVEEISNTSMDEIAEQFDKGNNLLKTIRKDNFK